MVKSFHTNTTERSPKLPARLGVFALISQGLLYFAKRQGCTSVRKILVCEALPVITIPTPRIIQIPIEAAGISRIIPITAEISSADSHEATEPRRGKGAYDTARIIIYVYVFIIC